MRRPYPTGRRPGRMGGQRLQILQAWGVAETDVVVVDLSGGEEKALNVALNSPQLCC